MKNQINLKLSDFTFHHELKTRWCDLDAFNHINNATFLSYIEDARIVFFKRWGINFKEKSLIVAAVKIDYINQLGHPSNIIVGQKVSRIGSKSFDIQSALFKNKTLICCSIITSVCYDFINSKTVPVYDEIKADHKV